MRKSGVVMLAVLLLTACSSVEERQQRALGVVHEVEETASGATVATRSVFRGALDAALLMITGWKSVVEGVDRRVDAVTEGARKIEEGREQIEEGIRGDPHP